MSFGLTPTGFLPATLTDVREDITTRVRDTIARTLDTSDRSLEGQIIGIVAEAISKLWDLGQKIDSARDPDKAIGAALEALCALTGTIRRAATFSTVTLTLTGTPATLVPAGSIARVSGRASFATDNTVTITAVPSRINSAYYAEGSRVENDGNIYQAVSTGITAASGGPVGTDTDATETDGAVTWRFLGAGSGAIDVQATATETGPLDAFSATILEIVTPVGGWEAVNNVLDADVGRDVMTDAELRVLRELELARPGTSTQNAIRAALLAVADVLAVTVFVNNTDVTNAEGMPPHSVEALVRGGDSQDLWDTLFANVAAGIQTYGTEIGTVSDSQGTSHTMRFSRVEDIDIYVVVNLVKDPAIYPVDGDAQVAAAIVAYGDVQDNGRDAVASALTAQVFKIQGVLDVTALYLGTAPAPGTNATVPISVRQRAVYDTSRITVTSTNGIP
jgi:uncharacterized phage protein gp47/JayE